MMSGWRNQATASELETSSIESDQTSDRPSLMYTVLPAVVQNRIPALPSLRRSLSGIRGRVVHVKSGSTVAEITTAPETPPPGYTSRPGSAGANRTSLLSATDTEEFEFQDDISERPISSSLSTPPPFAISETKTGINWKYANQGISLLTQSYAESCNLTREVDETSTVLTRQLYLHGMTYLLRGLPAELTPEETLSLQAAVPQNIINVQNDCNAHALVPVSRDTTMTHGGPPPDASILHRITATVVFQTFVLIQFLLPYIKLFIGHAYRFEKEHKITQRLVNKSIVTVDEIGRKSLQLSQTVCQMNNGKVGQALNDLTFWWVRGLTGGIQQGITEGVTMFGERPISPKGRVEKVD